MDIDLHDGAREYGQVAARAFESVGGDALVRRAEADPALRAALVEPVLAELGAWDLDVRGCADELEAAAALCRSAGAWSVPYPVAERLAAPRDLEAGGLVAVGPARPAAALAGLGHRWAAVELSGRRSLATARPAAEPARRTAFVAGLDLEPVDEVGPAEVALALVLPCWTLLGVLDRALALTRTYVREREQFGQPIGSFQGVQFQLTDAEVQRAGAQELAGYALWSLQAGRAEALEDALALRVAALEAAEVVFRVAHQLHGAIGFCDEATLSWLSRHSQPLRRLPEGRSATLHHLTRRIGRRGLTGLYSEAVAGS